MLDWRPRSRWFEPHRHHCVVSLSKNIIPSVVLVSVGAQWLSGRVLDSRPRSHWFEPHRHHFVVSLSKNINPSVVLVSVGAQWLSGRVLDSRPRSRWFEPQWHHCVVSLSKSINPSVVLVQPRKTCPFITERLLIGRKESNKQTNKEYCFFSQVG